MSGHAVNAGLRGSDHNRGADNGSGSRDQRVVSVVESRVILGSLNRKRSRGGSTDYGNNPQKDIVGKPPGVSSQNGRGTVTGSRVRKKSALRISGVDGRVVASLGNQRR